MHVCIAKPAADIQGRFALPVKPGIPCGEQPPVCAEQPAHERQPHNATVAVPGQHGLHAEGAPLRQLVVTVRQQQEKGGLSGLRADIRDQLRRRFALCRAARVVRSGENERIFPAPEHAPQARICARMPRKPGTRHS